VADGQSRERGTGRLIITVLAVGKAAKGPERDLCARYVERAGAAGRQLGVTRVDMLEVPDGRGGRKAEDEAARLLARRPQGILVALDEHGGCVTSAGFARRLQHWLDAGETSVAFALGGADGHGESLLEAADWRLSLGPMTLPHLLARVIVLEQIYRAVTIRLGHPYHRA